VKLVPLRLQPGDDLRQALETWMGEQQEQAGCVISAVGSLSVAQLRYGGLLSPPPSAAIWRSSAWPAPFRPMALTCTSPSQSAAAT